MQAESVKNESGWYWLYKNNHYSGGMDFDYFSAIICSQNELICKLGILIDDYVNTTNPYFKSWTRRLILEILEYFRVHMWDKVILKNFQEAEFFLNQCVGMKEILDTKDFIGNREIRALAHNLLIGTADDIVSKNNVLKDFSAGRGEHRQFIIRNKNLFIHQSNLPETFNNKNIREQAKYLLINFVPDTIPEDVISGVTKLVLGRAKKL